MVWGCERGLGDSHVTLPLSDITLSQSCASARLSPPPFPAQISASRVLKTRAAAAAGADAAADAAAAEPGGSRPCSFQNHDRRY